MSLVQVFLFVVALIGLGGCDGGGSGVGTTIQTSPPGASAIVVTSGTSFSSSPVRISFNVTNFTIGLSGTPHMRFSINGDAPHDFYNGAGINSDNGVLLSGAHDHFVHWASPSSFDVFALAAGSHQVRLALVDENNQELSGASTTHNFTVLQPPTGDLQLELKRGGLNFPVGLSQASDGRIFYSERLTGAVRIIDPTWQQDTLFCQVSVGTIGGEDGLLGLTLVPGFSSSNESVYIYYTTPSLENRVSTLTKSSGVCTETIILDHLPFQANHNGGIIQFGPDGKLYVVIGDVGIPSNAQDLTTLAGKILRVNVDGSAPSDNPFFSDPNANAQKVYSYGHRNSYGFTFHPANGQLWESENGPDNNDEVNRILPSHNYGWDSNLRGGILNDPCCVDPILVFNPVIAPTGIIAIPAGSPVYPSLYHNNLLVADFIGGRIQHLVLDGSLTHLVSSSVAYSGGVGGLLSFMRGSDGYIYVSNMEGIFRVVAASH